MCGGCKASQDVERLDIAVAFDHFLGLEPRPAVHVGRLPKRVTVGIRRFKVSVGAEA